MLSVLSLYISPWQMNVNNLGSAVKNLPEFFTLNSSLPKPDAA